MPNNDTVTKIVTDTMVALQTALLCQMDDIILSREVSARQHAQLRECIETLVSGTKDVLIHKLSPVAVVQGAHSPAQQDSGTVALPPAPKPILITYSPTAGLTPEQLATLEGKRLNWSTHLHIQDVQNTMKFLTDRLTEKADRHDFTKLIGSEAFLNYVHNNFQGDWWQHHLEAEPHHLHYTHQLTLLDILEHVADGCCAGMARTGTVRGFKIPNAVLERAVDNTMALLVSNMECVPHASEISRAQMEKMVAAIEQGAPFDEPQPEAAATSAMHDFIQLFQDLAGPSEAAVPVMFIGDGIPEGDIYWVALYSDQVAYVYKKFASGLWSIPMATFQTAYADDALVEGRTAIVVKVSLIGELSKVADRAAMR